MKRRMKKRESGTAKENFQALAQHFSNMNFDFKPFANIYKILSIWVFFKNTRKDGSDL
jgi:hypothetical protein